MDNQHLFPQASSANPSTSSPDSSSAPQPKKKSRRGGDGPQKRRCEEVEMRWRNPKLRGMRQRLWH
ncbi:hypothetical protein COL922a_004796 [Colletotrichum nupharicola]|nr:hypothetical protein COL940_007171 [Colletotrichum noveboracense]KAJ0339090.1 hypothetical protein COL922a_004796 [Colletotrichum nupharicola]